MAAPTKAGRTRVERGIYRQPNGKFAVCARRAGRLHFRTCGRDLGAARRAREELIAALEAGRMPASPRLRLDTVAGRWSTRFEAMVAAGERHRRTYEAHRFHFDHHLLPRLGHLLAAHKQATPFASPTDWIFATDAAPLTDTATSRSGCCVALPTPPV